MNMQIYDEATQWLIRHRDGGLNDSDKPVFDRWLRTSPEHVRAYLEMSAVWEDVSTLNPQDNVAAEDLITRAREAGPGNVVPLSSVTTFASQPSAVTQIASVKSSRPRARWAIAASFALVAVAGALWLWTADAPIYTTEVGEQRSIVLADGSMVELNSRSRMKVKFTGTQRRIELLEGQAMFQVVQDRTRPFIVHSDDTRVQAVGTKFDVYRKKDGIVVTVIEGRVAVRSGDSMSEPEPARKNKFLSAGEQLTLAPQTPAQPRRIDIAAATAWTSRHLVFDAASLTEVAEEFNRYNTRQLVIADPGLAALNVSGVFSSSDPSLLLKFLRGQPEIAVDETPRNFRIVRK